MGKNNGSESHSTRKSSSRVRPILGTMLFLLASWILVTYVHNLDLARYASTAIVWVMSNLSMFRLTLVVGFGGSLLSIPFLRRRGHDLSAQTPVEPYQSNGKKVHPLMLGPRPARDSQLIIRKTKKRGRIARNRAGERLPAILQD